MNDENQKTNPNVSSQVSSVRRELETNSSGYISHTEQAPVIPDEVKEAGVEAVTHPEVHTQEPTLVKEYPEVVGPLTEKSNITVKPVSKPALPVEQAVKTEDIEDSYTWFLALVQKVRSKMNILSLNRKTT
jgi:hypothetical protein